VDTILIILFDSKASEEVIFGKGGLVEGDLKGKTVVDMTTNHYAYVQSAYNELKGLGCSYLDAPVLDQLKAKYGAPKKFVKPWLADGVAEWRFQDVVIRLLAPWVSWSMYLIYEHIPLSKEVEESDQEVFQKETAKPRRGL